MTRDSRSDGGRDGAVEAARARLSDAREALAAAERALARVEEEGARQDPDPRPETPEATWRERLWSAPGEARIGVAELVKALGVSESWVYQRTRADADPRLPHGKLAGSLVFRVGEVRAWLRDHEQVVESYRSEPAPGELTVETGGRG